MAASDNAGSCISNIDIGISGSLFWLPEAF